jgi:hypothetical protein
MNTKLTENHRKMMKSKELRKSRESTFLMELAFSTSFLTNILRWYWNWIECDYDNWGKGEVEFQLVLYCDEFLGCEKRQ